MIDLSGLLTSLDYASEYLGVRDSIDSSKEDLHLALPESARPAVLAKLFLDRRRPILLLTGKVEAVARWQEALNSWLPGDYSVLRFPEPTPLPFERGPWSSGSRLGRLAILRRLVENQHPLLPAATTPLIIIASSRALLHKTLPKRRFVASTRILRAGQLIDLDHFLAHLSSIGYEQVTVVDGQGQYSKRGGIIDIFPVGAAKPDRIELFGDEIETIRPFNPATQRSARRKQQSSEFVLIPPARELLPMDAISVGQTLNSQAQNHNQDLPSWYDDIDDLSLGRINHHIEFYLSMAYSNPASLIDYLTEDTLLFTDDLNGLKDGVHEVLHHAEQIAGEQFSTPPGYVHPLFDWEELYQNELRGRLIDLGSGEIEEPYQPGHLERLFQPGPRFGGQVQPFVRQLQVSQLTNERTVIVSQQAQRLAELWRENQGAKFSVENLSDFLISDSLSTLPAEGEIAFVHGSLTGGFILDINTKSRSVNTNGKSLTVNLLTDAEIFGWSRPVPRRRISPRPTAPEAYFADIQPGDFVVHIDYGIGRFLNLVVRSIGGTEREYLKVDYANGDVLYVPVHHADRLSRWIGPDDRLPKLHRLGEKRWRNTKSKAQEAATELAVDLLELYAERETVSGHAFSADTPWQKELEASFPYTETEDQFQAIGDVKVDMERAYPMDRLICGDVGYGKTEVALRAAFKAVMDGKQIAILVPTTVLAQQHFTTFSERLKPFPVSVEMLSRFRTPAQQEAIVKKLRDGLVDIVIGTHRLLSEDVSFKDLGLLVIDEEQRFGVAHKEKLKQFRREIDVLTMTATPIPRTLYMGLTGVRDISQIDTAPADRLPVQNFVGEADDTIIRRAILREIDRGGQVFYVHNRVQSIDNLRLKLAYLVPDATVAVGHGQMSERELEEVMVRFVAGEIDVLLSTSIIESGLDIPNANTLIVDRADQFGLAQLYQLRGRVGRGIRRAHAFFLHPAWHKLTNDAKSRLEVITSQTELGAGYTIAMRDLEIRGAGDLLGNRQSGHIAAVGFDLYTRLLAQAVKRQKSSRGGGADLFEIPESVTIDLPLAAYVPTDYIPDSSLRLRLYRRMAVLTDLDSIDEMAAELADRFGPIPDPVDNLLFQLRIKVLARKAGIPAVSTENGQVQLRLPEGDGDGRIRLQHFLGKNVRVSRNSIWLSKSLSTREWQVTLVQLLEKYEGYRNQKSQSA